MTQSMLTIIAPLNPEHVGQATELIEALGNPAGTASAGPSIASEIAGRAGPSRDGGRDELPFVHFASLNAVLSHEPAKAFLVLELSADGAPDDVIDELSRRAAHRFLPIFELSADFAGDAPDASRLADFWKRHQVRCGHRLFEGAGLSFSGTPDKTVVDILREKALAERVMRSIAAHGEQQSSVAHIEAVRRALKRDPSDVWSWVFGEHRAGDAVQEGRPTLYRKMRTLVLSLLTDFLWPILLPATALAVWAAWPSDGWSLRAATLFPITVIGLALSLTLAVLLALYAAFRKAEGNDAVSGRGPSVDETRALLSRENAPGHVQNHMLSHTVRKPGVLRFVTLRLAFWAIAMLSQLNSKPGFLGDIGTIHFARWVTIPKTRDVLFLSNYGGSWESYLEDFITKAHEGLTAAWSNTEGFPRSSNLFQDGATDGENFKRFARASMVPTSFWYSAYPTLTTDNIRRNALVRKGLSTARTESEATRWLTLFGSEPRPPAKLDTTQIQSIVFGGLGFKPEGRLLTVRLEEGSVPANRRWLRRTMPLLSFNDGRYIEEPAVVTLALTPRGLSNLGLPKDALDTFPAAFLMGMDDEVRARILGDVPPAAGDERWWGDEETDAVLLVYGDTVADVDSMCHRIRVDPGCERIVDCIDLVVARDRLVDRKEPFGFVDGVSQPAIRGTYRGLRNADPIHLVEPGEFIVGYPDNRGNIPPGPIMEARHDVDMMLPLAGEDHGFADAGRRSPRLVGFNGSFLVIRQLEQDVDAFDAFCRRQAQDFAGRFPAPAICDAEFIAAKMIGRWMDGSSLVRHPYMSATKLRTIYGKDGDRPASREESDPADAAATPVEGADRGDRVATAGGSVMPDNDFLFGTEDPQGLRCPYGSHVRRVNPRDSLSPGSMEQIEITNRHRIIRIGRGFAADPRKGRGPGLMFMCLNGDIERQFEFVQQTWMGSAKFHGLTSETDPIVVAGKAGSNDFTIPVRTGPVALGGLPRFVTLRGGGYYFLPGRQLLRFLAGRMAAVDVEEPEVRPLGASVEEGRQAGVRR